MTTPAGWFPLALAADIPPGTATGARLCGRELAVWRDAAGACHVWEDRCPHRGMRLSFGFVRGDRLACLYHGWQFDGGGRCRLIPAHPALDVPPTIVADTLPCAERLGIVWVLSGERAPADGPPGEKAEALPVRSLAIDAPAASVLAALAGACSLFEDQAVTFDQDGQLVTLRAGAERLYAAVQPAAHGETVLHLALDPAQAARRQAVSWWAEALRRAVEAAHPPAAAAP